MGELFDSLRNEPEQQAIIVSAEKFVILNRIVLKSIV